TMASPRPWPSVVRSRSATAQSPTLNGLCPSYTGGVTLSIEVPPEVLARLEAAASARGVTVEQLAADTLAQVATVDAEVLDVVRDTVAEHREILDRLAAT